MAGYLAKEIAGEVVGLLGLGRWGRARRHSRHQSHLDRVDLRQAEREERLRGKLLSRRVSMPSMDPALVRDPATGALVPVEKGGIAQGKLFPLGSLTLGPSTAAGDVFPGTLTTRAQKNFRPTRLVVTSTLPDNTAINGVWIGTTLQQATRAAMSVRMFQVDTTFAEVDFDVLTPGEDASIDFIFTATAAAQTSLNTGQYYGTQF